MSKKFIYKRHVFLWHALLWSGLSLFLISLILFGILGQLQSLALYLCIVLSFLLLILSALVGRAKCRCPYCACGRSGSKFGYDGKYHSLLTIRNAKQGEITCPKCRNRVGIK